MDVQIEASWKRVLQEEFDKPYFEAIVRFLKEQKRQGRTIYPPGKQIFHAFELCPFDQVRCVLLGQDPYHGPGQAHGLCFSVPPGVTAPPSLKNIFKELAQDPDLSWIDPSSGNLEPWARQGVLLLNAFLTVEANQPASHSHIGWETFTDAVIRTVSQKRKGTVFLLWGRFAQNKESLIDANEHLILKAAHPSPFSADKGFFGCRHFSQTNAYLKKQGRQPIDWVLK